jgi:hypothetical protein
MASAHGGPSLIGTTKRMALGASWTKPDRGDFGHYFSNSIRLQPAPPFCHTRRGRRKAPLHSLLGLPPVTGGGPAVIVTNTSRPSVLPEIHSTPLLGAAEEEEDDDEDEEDEEDDGGDDDESSYATSDDAAEYMEKVDPLAMHRGWAVESESYMLVSDCLRKLRRYGVPEINFQTIELGAAVTLSPSPKLS